MDLRRRIYWNKRPIPALRLKPNGNSDMDANAERHRAQAASYFQIAKMMTNEATVRALHAKAADHLLKAKAIEERERQVEAFKLVGAGAVNRNKDKRASILDAAKKEALTKAKAAVAELNYLGLNYTLSNGARKQGHAGLAKGRRVINTAVCPLGRV